jgi:hypothetical protein
VVRRAGTEVNRTKGFESEAIEWMEKVTDEEYLAGPVTTAET